MRLVPIAIYGGLALAGGMAVYRNRPLTSDRLGPNPIPGHFTDLQGTGWSAPVDLGRRCQDAWERNGRPLDREAFAVAMQTSGIYLPQRAWLSIWTQTIGSSQAFPNEWDLKVAAERAVSGQAW